ncbi:hypothetical protein LTR47_011722 [Exophiala xenobiotica]|nr:hypothetical protein LTR47_011722 [Exophiala xenobiotica]KAK5242947.1 hypothetical protein LTS06_011170 [Exophiala xenobiotica]KAK5281453.1 hypothetical protein LTR40_004829 [Exophiala xenobiotica]KAK5356177.1 hypothetical protein LTR11_011639 [Exophiala xenobiotica]
MVIPGISSMNNLAEVLRQQDKYDKAVGMHRQTLALKKKVLKEEHEPSVLNDQVNKSMFQCDKD